MDDLKQMTGEKTRSTTRRTFLASAVAGGLAATAGCQVRMPTQLFGEPDPPPFGPVEHGWEMAGRDGANTAHNPGADGPQSEPEPIWELDIGETTIPRTVVAGDTLVVGGEEELFVFDLSTNELSWSTTVAIHLADPVLLDGRVYIQTDTRELSCFDAQTGENQWSVTTRAAVRTPTVTDRAVFVPDEEGTIHTYDVETGNEKWQTASELPRPREQYAVTKEAVYLGRSGTLLALDIETGDELWRTDEHGGRVTFVDNSLYTGGNEMSAHDSDGTLLWNVDLNRLAGGYSTPTIVNGRAVTTISGGHIEVLSAESGESLWKDGERSWYGRPITDGSMIYVASDYRARRVYALDPVSETVEWMKRVPEAPGYLRVVDDMLLVGIATGKLLAFA